MSSSTSYVTGQYIYVHAYMSHKCNHKAYTHNMLLCMHITNVNIVTVMPYLISISFT